MGLTATTGRTQRTSDHESDCIKCGVGAWSAEGEGYVIEDLPVCSDCFVSKTVKMGRNHTGDKLIDSTRILFDKAVYCAIMHVPNQEYPVAKIGYSKSIRSRIRNVKSFAPWPMEVTHAISPGGIRLERQTQFDLGDYCLRGEWFEYTPEVKEYLDNLSSEPLPITKRRALATWEVAFALGWTPREVKFHSEQSGALSRAFDGQLIANTYCVDADSVIRAARRAGIKLKDIRKIKKVGAIGLLTPITGRTAVQRCLDLLPAKAYPNNRVSIELLEEWA